MSNFRSAIQEIYRRHDDFIFIGLTGRTGSGCSTVASILTGSFDGFSDSIYEQLSGNQYRKYKILYKSLHKNWISFDLIQVRSIITLMLSQEKRKGLIEYFSKFFQPSNDKSELVISILAKIRRHATNSPPNSEKYIIFHTLDLPKYCEELRILLGPDIFVSLYQAIGKNLRSSGSTLSKSPSEGNFFVLAKKIEEIAININKINSDQKNRTAIVVDAIRSPLEAMYFQDRYATFYLMAVSCSEEDRSTRLLKIGYSNEGISSIDSQEGTGQDIDKIDYYSSQNIPACLQRADIYLHNPRFDSKSDQFDYLKRQIVKFTSLMHTPGIVTPSATERCMQIAHTAKLNSGCISRQVGAVVTGNDYSIKAVGWNDVPGGHVPCNLRSRLDLSSNIDEGSYSSYEKNNEKFRSQIANGNKLFTPIIELGRNPSYCFKSEYKTLTGKDNQVHTRALHAEENAFLQISKHGGMHIKGGFLFSTASPCELCAKKSVQLGIDKIFYIDPYPGISESHIIEGGKNPPKMRLFEGAIGKAFHNLYAPTVPYKDELSAIVGTVD